MKVFFCLTKMNTLTLINSRLSLMRFCNYLTVNGKCSYRAYLIILTTQAHISRKEKK